MAVRTTNDAQRVPRNARDLDSFFAATGGGDRALPFAMGVPAAEDDSSRTMPQFLAKLLVGDAALAATGHKPERRHEY
jgi:hypothetical protein